MRDFTDRYIVAHYRSMSYGDMADKLGINKSTVSRRAAALREAGEIEAKPSGADMAQTRALRERLKGCTVDRFDRLEALGELRELLHDDLKTAGGHGLARVSSEYRAVLAEIETLSTELELTQDEGRKNVSAIDLLRLKRDVAEEHAGLADREIAGSIALSVLRRLGEIDAISITPLDLIQAEADEYGGENPQPAEQANQA